MEDRRDKKLEEIEIFIESYDKYLKDIVEKSDKRDEEYKYFNGISQNSEAIINEYIRQNF